MYAYHAPFACGPPWARRHARFGGPRGGRCGPPSYPNREEWLSALEEHQKDLEQQVADIADLIRRLKDEPEAEAAD
jgi:hypothetical protein